jgi:transcriptional regulator
MDSVNQQETVRQQIIGFLKEGPATALDISQHVHISEKEVYQHLGHVERSVVSRREKLVVHPAQCLKCGFVFKGRKRLKAPGRCPLCKSTHLQKPNYEIVRE